MSASPIRVMICDDSAAFRQGVTRMLQTDPAVRVVAQAGDGNDAVAQLSKTEADLVLLDITMPGLDGIAALPLIRRARPKARVVMTSATTTRDAALALGALRLGAVDFISKPTANADSNAQFRQEILTLVHGCAPRRAESAALSLRQKPLRRPLIVAIGSSTGGPHALFSLIKDLGVLSVPILITQHMPPLFLTELAAQITRLGYMRCTLAKDGELLRSGHIYLAPGEQHLLLEAGKEGPRLALSSTPPENFCRPAVDPMLRSVCDVYNGRALAVILTGMGQDGLAGTRYLVEQGGGAIAQDAATSVVWGMPGSVAKAGLCHDVLPIEQIGARIKTILGAQL